MSDTQHIIERAEFLRPHGLDWRRYGHNDIVLFLHLLNKLDLGPL